MTVVQRLAATYQTRLIIACAMLESAALLNLIAYMIEGSYFTLVAASVLLVIILNHFPTLGRLEDWVARELENMQQMRIGR